jgi:hypothetical protein
VGQIRNADCEFIDRELKSIFPDGYEIECRQDTYTQDYIIWVTANDMVQPFRITRDEFLEDDWRGNVRRLAEELKAVGG